MLQRNSGSVTRNPQTLPRRFHRFFGKKKSESDPESEEIPTHALADLQQLLAACCLQAMQPLRAAAGRGIRQGGVVPAVELGPLRQAPGRAAAAAAQQRV
eukprot:COSAG01_NODE_1471_length_10198_cov_4.595703_1_plen_100_part_00